MISESEALHALGKAAIDYAMTLMESVKLKTPSLEDANASLDRLKGAALMYVRAHDDEAREERTENKPS